MRQDTGTSQGEGSDGPGRPLLGRVVLAVVTLSVVGFALWRGAGRGADATGLVYVEGLGRASYGLPIRTEREAREFFLDQADVQKEIAGAGRWWVRASRFDPRNLGDVWLVMLGNGTGECGSPHQCYMHVHDNGTVRVPLTCSDGWNCK